MFRFYELYSLYLKKMSISCGWCLCEKLPRSILHLSPTPEVWCEVCGRRRRPRACLSSSSDEEERAAQRRQKLLAEHRQRNDPEERHGLVRVKVAMRAKKPKPRPKSHCRKCMVGTVQAQQLNTNYNSSSSGNNNHCNSNITSNNNNSSNINNSNNKSKTYAGRFGCYRKPQRLALSTSSPSKRHTADATKAEAHGTQAIAPQPPCLSPPAGESLGQQPDEDLPNLESFAHEVFNHPMPMHQAQSCYYNNLFVSELTPLDKPITDATGGAISKQRRIIGRSHYSQPLPPLSQVLSEMLNKQQEIRSKGGGLTSKVDETLSATQFSPFNSYEGPSEDALVVDSARQMLRQPMALYIDERDDLPNTRLSSFESEPSSDCSSSSPFDMPSAPPTGFSVGPPLQLHNMMKTVAQTGLFDSSASSSSSSESISSHKSSSSALPMRCRGGEEDPLFLSGKPVESDFGQISIMEKILWLIEQKPGTDPEDLPMIVEPDPDNMENTNPDSFEGLLQLMENLQIDSNLMQNNVKTTAQECSQTETEIGAPNPSDTTTAHPLPDIEHHSHYPTNNDMSNETHLNSTNKSEGDEKYEKGFSGMGGTASTSSSSSMWSIISGFFGKGTKRIDPGKASAGKGELQPLKGKRRSQYGAINSHKEAPANCLGKNRIDPKVLANSHSNCQKCGRIRAGNKLANPKAKETGISSECISASTTYKTAKTAEDPKVVHCDPRKKNATNLKPLTSKDIHNLTDCRSKKESNCRSNVPIKPRICKTHQEIAKNLENSIKCEKKHQITELPKHLNNLKGEELLRDHNKTSVTENVSKIYRKPPFDKSEKLKKDPIDITKDSQQLPKQKVNRAIITNDITEDNMRDRKLKSKTKEHQKRGKPEKKTSSTNFESCFGTVRSLVKYSNLKPGEQRRNLQLQEILKQLKVIQPSSPKVYHTAKVLGLVQYECGEIMRPRMSYSSETCMQRINKYYLRPPNSVKSLALLEFRTPDIQRTESYDNNAEKTSDKSLGFLTNNKCGQQLENYSLKGSLTDIKKSLSKRKLSPVWPAQPARHRRYKAMKVELTYAVTEENVEVEKPDIEQYHQPDINRQRRKKKHDRWLGNYGIQQKINEMMTKPIKLLG